MERLTAIAAKGYGPLMVDMIQDVDEAVRRLAAGRVVVLPTQTVYGVTADASNEDAVRAIFGLKARPASRPLPVLIADDSQLDIWSAGQSATARRLASAFWPGPLTLVLPCAEGVDPLITGGGDTIGLRVPAHPLTLAVLKGLGRAIVAPSANRHGALSPTSADAVPHALGPGDYSVLDGGVCNLGIESTVLAIASERVNLLRRGAISVDALEEALGEEGAVEEVSTARTTRFRLNIPTEILTPEAFARRSSEWAGTRTMVIACPDVQRPVDIWKFERLPVDEGHQNKEVYRLIRDAEQAKPERLLVVLGITSELRRVLQERLQ